MDRSKVVYLDNVKKTPIETPFYEKNWFKTLSRLINILIKIIPPLRKFVAKSIPNLSRRTQKLYREGKYIEALELSIIGLVKCGRKNEMYNWYWWSFLSYAVYCADCLKSAKIMNLLISISKKSPQPHEGSDAAYCYCRFSHFKYAQEEYDAAIHYADLAKNADDKSGEAYYLLGFYELFINEDDPMKYFSAAVERDHKILSWISHHPYIKEFPGIINELTELHQITSKDCPNKGINQTR
jgi:hypothetical protein